MPTAITILPSVQPLQQSSTASPIASTSLNSTSSVSRSDFGTILARTTGATSSSSSSSPTSRSTTTGANAVGTDTGTTSDDSDNATAATVDATQLAAQAAAGLLVVGPGIVLSSTGSPVATAQPAATTVEPAGATQTQSPAQQIQIRQTIAPQTQPQPVLRRATLPEVANQATTPAPESAAAAQAATPANQAQLPGVLQAATPAANNVVPTTGLPPGRAPVVTAQSPVVADLAAPRTVPPTTIEIAPAPITAPVAASALPDVQVGTRPTMAGEGFAAIVADADRLAAQRGQTQPNAFAAVLAGSPIVSAPVSSTPSATAGTSQAGAVGAAPVAAPQATVASQAVTPPGVATATVAPPPTAVPSAAALPDGLASTNMAGVGDFVTSATVRVSPGYQAVGGSGVAPETTANRFTDTVSVGTVASPQISAFSVTPSADGRPAVGSPTVSTVQAGPAASMPTPPFSASGWSATPVATGPTEVAASKAQVPAVVANSAVPAGSALPVSADAVAAPLAGEGSVATAFARIVRGRYFDSGASSNGQPAGEVTGATPTADTSNSMPIAGAPAHTQPNTPASTVNAPTPTAQPVAVQVADEVVTHAKAVARDGTVEFHMRLDPPELGQVRVHLIADGDAVRGQVVVADDSVRRMIESQLPELRQRLEAAGVTVQQFDVSTGSGSGGGNAHYGDYSPSFAPAPAAPPVATQQQHTHSATGVSATGRLDVTV